MKSGTGNRKNVFRKPNAHTYHDLVPETGNTCFGSLMPIRNKIGYRKQEKRVSEA
jgi:hypothetical protein